MTIFGQSSSTGYQPLAHGKKRMQIKNVLETVKRTVTNGTPNLKYRAYICKPLIDILTQTEVESTTLKTTEELIIL